MANKAKPQNDSPIVEAQELKSFIDVTMTDRSTPYRRLKIGLVSENTKKLLDNKFGFGVQDIDIDKDGVIHAMDKPTHNLEPDDLLRVADIVFDAWRKQKARRRSNAVQAPPGTYVQNGSPRASVTSLSPDSAEESSGISDTRR
jgi:hypothetical protein